MRRQFLRLAAILAFTLVAAISATGQDVDPDQGKMGTYIALAQLANQAYQQRADSNVAALARILEKTWDRQESDLRKTSPDVWSKIDGSMDQFIKPLTGYKNGGHAEPTKENAAFEQYLSNLRAAN